MNASKTEWEIKRKYGAGGGWWGAQGKRSCGIRLVGVGEDEDMPC